MKTTPARKLFLIINVMFLTIISLVCVLPFLNLLAISFSDKNAVAMGRVTFWPVEFTISSYEFITYNSSFLRSVWVSVQRVLLGVSINLVLIVLTSYPLSKEKNEFRMRSVY
jgi:putative aldouronate transport system permease protein